MSYTNATFFMDYEGGSDAARVDLVPTAYANNGAGLVRVTCNSTAAYATGAVFDVAGTTGSVYVGGWIVTIVDGTHVDLQGSTFTVNPAAKGTMIPRGGSQKTDAWKTMTSGATAARTAAGDAIRVMGSPAVQTMSVNGTWTNGPLPATVAIVSSTNATPIVVTLGAGHGIVTGDTVIVNAHTTNTKANGVWKVTVATNAITLLNADGTNSVGNGVGGATGTMRKVTNCAVILASAVTQTIALVGNQGTKTNWTPSANVTSTVITTDFKEGGECVQIAANATFTTGLAAFFATGTLDLSTYQQVTFWVKQTAGTVAIAGDASIRLCTNADGTGSTHTAPIPALGSLNQWVPVTWDNTANLNAAIKSVALYIDTDRAAVTFNLDCILAVKASSSVDSLSLTSLIGKNTGVETYCAIQSINNVRVMLDRDVNSRPASAPQRGYSGTTETVTANKRETIKTTVAAATNTVVQQFNKDGAAGSLISFEGGWDRTNMTTQNLETWFDGQNGLGQGITFPSTRAYGSINKINGVRYYDAVLLSTSGVGNVVNNYHYNNNSNNGLGVGNGAALANNVNVFGACVACCYNANDGIGVYGSDANSFVSFGLLNSNASFGLEILSSSNSNVLGPITAANNNGGSGVGIAKSSNNTLGAIAAASGNVSSGLVFSSGGTTTQPVRNRVLSVVANSNSSGVTFGGSENFVGGGSTASNTNGVVIGTTNGEWNYMRNFTVSDSVSNAVTAFTNGRLMIEQYGGTFGDNRVYTDGGAILCQNGGSGASTRRWTIQPTSANRSANYPLGLLVAEIACTANKTVNITIDIRRDNTTTLVAKLVCPGGQIAGIASDVTVTASGAINTWATETLPTMTPTENGVIQVFAQAYGGTTGNADFSNIIISTQPVNTQAMGYAFQGQPFVVQNAIRRLLTVA